MILLMSINRGLIDKTESSCQRQSFSEKNFLGDLLSRKEILI